MLPTCDLSNNVATLWCPSFEGVGGLAQLIKLLFVHRIMCSCSCCTWCKNIILHCIIVLVNIAQEQEEEERKKKLRQAEEDKKKAEEEAKLEKERQVSRRF